MSDIRIFLIILFLMSHKANASEWTWQDFKREVTSPLYEPAKPVTQWGGAAALTVIIFEDQLSDGIEEETYENRPLGDASAVGDVAGQLVPNVLYAGGMALHGYISEDQVSYRRANSMAKGSAYAVGLSTLLKYTVQQKRPNSNKRTSFPSGHTTSATAFAAVVVCEHGWNWAGISATLLASMSGYSRLNDHQHYFHDVIAGAVIGTAYGIGISSLNMGITASSSAKSTTSTFLPIIGEDKYGIAWFGTY